MCPFIEVRGEDAETLLDINCCPCCTTYRPHTTAITYCRMIEEHVSFPAQDTLTELLVEFTVKARGGQLRVVHTAKNIHLPESFNVVLRLFKY